MNNVYKFYKTAMHYCISSSVGSVCLADRISMDGLESLLSCPQSCIASLLVNAHRLFFCPAA